MLNVIVPNLDRRSDRWKHVTAHLVERGVPENRIKRFPSFDGRNYISLFMAQEAARSYFNGELPAYLKRTGAPRTATEYCWNWTWYSILWHISTAPIDHEAPFTLVLIDDHQLLIDYDELVGEISLLLEHGEAPDIIQLSIPNPKHYSYKAGRPAVTPSSRLLRGMGGRSDSGVVMSASGARTLMRCANDQNKTLVPAGVMEVLSDETNHKDTRSRFAPAEILATGGNACGRFEDRIENLFFDDISRYKFETAARERDIAFVGEASYLEGITQGEHIDSHATIVRMYDPWLTSLTGDTKSLVPVALQQNVGAKTDILFIDSAQLPLTDIPALVRRCRAAGVQVLAVNNPGNIAAAAQQIDQINNDGPPVHVLPFEHYVNLTRQLGFARPSNGTMLLYSLLLAHPQALYFTGMTFPEEHIADAKLLYHLTRVNDGISCDAVTQDALNQLSVG